LLQCRCVRCLKEFSYALEIDDWVRHLPLEGEEAAGITNDCVDLTPYVREDILLALPQHPLCEANCRGLPINTGNTMETTNAGQPGHGSPAWDELKKLKFK
jgi:uncharacterized metal-binding protein YceD (DUF177 family)